MKRLTKSSDRVISGVLGGIADYLEVDPTLVRVVYVLASFGLLGSPVLIYIILALIMPDA